MDTMKTQAPKVGITNVSALPIVIKIEMPKDAEKQNKDDVEKPSKSRLRQLLPVLLFLATFATVLSLLIIYMDPSSK